MLRGQVADIAFGSVFLFIGFTACAIAAIRRRAGARIFVWLGIWSAMYGALQMSQSRAIVALYPPWFRAAAPYAAIVMVYLLLVAGSLAFSELSLGKVRLLTRATACLGLALTVAGVAILALTGSATKLTPLNNILAAAMLLILTAVVAVPQWSARYLVLPDRGVLGTGILVFAVEALYNNLSTSLNLPRFRVLDHLGFAVLLFSFGYVALRLVLASERRLLSVENELAIAREIQASILPRAVPELDRARISAAYHPMAAVAGDFYEFLPVDRNRAGFLVADVCGHGVPAALIASMLKIAVPTVAARACDPGAVLGGLNRLLTSELRGQLVSAAYLFLDTENRRALYAAAGHPPLLRWRQGRLEPVESNGILFGVLPEFDRYPVCAMAIEPGDRFLLYTDGVTEPENAAGEPFGEKRLERVVAANPSRTACELSDLLLAEIRQWQPASNPQQDDITLIVIDAV